MQWVKSGIENPSKLEVIGRCDGDEKNNDHTEVTKVKVSYVITLIKFSNLYSCITGQDILTAGFSGALHAGLLTASTILNRNLFNDITGVTKMIRKCSKSDVEKKMD